MLILTLDRRSECDLASTISQHSGLTHGLEGTDKAKIASALHGSLGLLLVCFARVGSLTVGPRAYHSFKLSTAQRSLVMGRCACLKVPFWRRMRLDARQVFLRLQVKLIIIICLP